MNFKNGVINIQAAGYIGAGTVIQLPFYDRSISHFFKKILADSLNFRFRSLLALTTY